MQGSVQVGISLLRKPLQALKAKALAQERDTQRACKTVMKKKNARASLEKWVRFQVELLRMRSMHAMKRFLNVGPLVRATNIYLTCAQPALLWARESFGHQ